MIHVPVDESTEAFPVDFPSFVRHPRLYLYLYSLLCFDDRAAYFVGNRHAHDHLVCQAL
jgi:hypothetical protein